MSVGRTIKLVQLARASQTALWSACATREGLARWQADKVSGEVRRGETLTLTWPSLQTELELSVRRVVEPELLVLAHEQSVVELRVEPGSVTVSQSGFLPDADVDGFASSWRVGLALMAHAVEEYPDQDRRVTWFVRRVRTTPQLSYLFFTEGPGLGVWLGATSGVGPTGSECSIRLARDQVLAGRVLARVAGRDVALGWPARRSALVLRTLPTPNAQERLVAMTCSTWGDAAQPEVDLLSAAFERLVQTLSRGGSA